MRRGTLRASLLLVAALTATAMFAGAAQARVRRSGASRSLTDLGGRHRATIADATSLSYFDGRVLHWNRTHLIFWQPSGSRLAFDRGYQGLIETFLRNVAAASRSSTNVFALTGQYADSNGPAAYASLYGGAVTDSHPLPPNACTEPPTGPGWSVCVTDGQLQRELEHVVRKDRLPTGPADVYFLITPDGLGDCGGDGPDSCALGGADGGYCGYHNQTLDGLVVYAVIPYNAVPGHCQSDDPRPNGSSADPAISTISHELSEMITDPVGNAWIDPNTGEEMGDLCLASFGPNIDGSTGAGAWNEDINGGHYYLQEEWSNHNGGCEPRARPDSVSFRAGLRSTQNVSIWFRARGYDPQGRIISYRWFFGDGRVGRGLRAVHRYGRTGRYHVVLRTTDSWGNWTYHAATLTVGRTGERPALIAKLG